MNDCDFVGRPVPSSARSSTMDITLILSGGPICVAALFAGAALTQGLDFYSCVISVVAGSFLLFVYGALLGGIGAHSGLSTGMLIAEAFGSLGSRVVASVLAICLVGWYAVQTGLFGQTIHALYPDGGILTSSRVASVWGGLLMLSTAYMGYRGLRLLSLCSVPLLVLLCIWGIYSAVSGREFSFGVVNQQASIGSGITMIFGAVSVGATVTADITRFARSTRAAFMSCFVSFFLVNTFMVLGGVMVALATGSGDLLSAMGALGLGVPALAILILGQWTTNDDNLYSAALGLTGAIPTWKKHYVVLAFGLFATTAAAVGVADLFVPFLITLGVAIPPIGGVLLAHRYIIGKGALRYAESKFSLCAFLAWGIGSAIGFYVPIGIPTVNSVVSAFCIYYLAQFSSIKTREVHAG